MEDKAAGPLTGAVPLPAVPAPGIRTDDAHPTADPIENKRVRRPRPSLRRAARWKCAECLCWNADGRRDCEVIVCPIYWWQPYRKLEPDLSWTTRKLVNRKAETP